MKAFRFYFTAIPEPPQRTVGDYSPEELNRFRREFEQRQKRIKTLRPPLVLAAVIALLITTVGRMGGARDHLFEWTIAWVISGLVFIAALAIIGFPKCPACQNDLDDFLGDYCPECGEKSVEKPGCWLQSADCTACEKELTRGKSRSYRIRVCTVCGVKLDDAGI